MGRESPSKEEFEPEHICLIDQFQSNNYADPIEIPPVSKMSLYNKNTGIGWMNIDCRNGRPKFCTSAHSSKSLSPELSPRRTGYMSLKTLRNLCGAQPARFSVGEGRRLVTAHSTTNRLFRRFKEGLLSNLNYIPILCILLIANFPAYRAKYPHTHA